MLCGRTKAQVNQAEIAKIHHGSQVQKPNNCSPLQCSSHGTIEQVPEESLYRSQGKCIIN